MIIGVIAGYAIRELSFRWKLVLMAPLALLWWLKMDFIRKDTAPRDAFEHEGAILRQAEVTSQTKVVMPVVVPEHRLQLDFYRKVKQEESGFSISVLDSRQLAKPGDQIIIGRENLKQMDRSVEVDTIKKWDGIGYEFQISKEW